MGGPCVGHVYQEVVMSAERSKKVRMFVDTGATYSVVSPALARELGITTLRQRQPIRLADGTRIAMKVGMAFFTILGRKAANTVLVGKVDEPILGVETLEALGLAVNPSTGQLNPTRSYAVRLGGAAVARRHGVLISDIRICPCKPEVNTSPSLWPRGGALETCTGPRREYRTRHPWHVARHRGCSDTRIDFQGF